MRSWKRKPSLAPAGAKELNMSNSFTMSKSRAPRPIHLQSCPLRNLSGGADRSHPSGDFAAHDLFLCRNKPKAFPSKNMHINDTGHWHGNIPLYNSCSLWETQNVYSVGPLDIADLRSGYPWSPPIEGDIIQDLNDGETTLVLVSSHPLRVGPRARSSRSLLPRGQRPTCPCAAPLVLRLSHQVGFVRN